MARKRKQDTTVDPPAEDSSVVVAEAAPAPVSCRFCGSTNVEAFRHPRTQGGHQLQWYQCRDCQRMFDWRVR